MSDFEKLNIVLAARDREFKRAMDANIRRIERFERRSKASLSKTSRHFDALGFASKKLVPLLAALSAGAVIGKLKRTTAALDDIGKTADKIGLTTDALQELRAVAESAGVSQSMLDSSLERFSKRLGEAALGLGAANKTLKEMNLSADDLATMGLDRALDVIADRMAAIPDPTERAARAAALFGREGVAMVNLMREGSDGMAKMRAEAHELGIIIDEDLIRGAEEAQTQLDLMGRVISAQLNSALIELAPLLVGGATAIADFVRGLVAAIEGVKGFLKPQSALEIATENLVSAMADEIRQSQLLQAALGNGIAMSVSAARQKLSEAEARHKNVQAIIAEHRALQLGSDEYQDLSETIRRTSADIDEMESVRDRAAEMGVNLPGLSSDDATHAAEIAAAYGRLNDAIQKRHSIQLHNDALDEQLATVEENIAKLKAGLENESGGVVTIDPTNYVTPIDNSPKKKISDTGSSAKVAVPDLSNYREVMARIAAVLGDVDAAGDGFVDMLAKAKVLLDTGQISGEEYSQMVKTIEAHFDDVSSAAENMEQAAEKALISIADRSKSASDAISDLLKHMGSLALNSAVSGLFDGAFDGIAGLFTSSPTVPLVGSNATGTDDWRGGLTRVNEQGGEIMNLPKGTQIIPHDISKMMAKNAGRAQSGTSAVEIRLGPGLEGSILQRAAGQSLQIVQMGMAEQDRQLGASIQEDLARNQ